MPRLVFDPEMNVWVVICRGKRWRFRNHADAERFYDRLLNAGCD